MSLRHAKRVDIMMTSRRTPFSLDREQRRTPMAPHSRTPGASVPRLAEAPASVGSRTSKVLLTTADYAGTLAAARALGRAGIDVELAEWRFFVPARLSRFVTKVYSCPNPHSAPDAFMAWLLVFGAENPGRVLMATSDDIAWLYASRLEVLSKAFLLPVPPFEVMETLLDKWRLYCACESLGIAAPKSLAPQTDAELEPAARQLGFPLMIKPRSQVFLSPHQKGRRVFRPEDLLSAYGDLCRATRHDPIVLASNPALARPLLQAYVDIHEAGVYNLSGFAAEGGELFAMRASRKVLQWPPRLGVGVCFEEADLDSALADQVALLCRSVGYLGPFEVEFLESGGRRLLIDFNPRFYNQMGFDIARGLNLPLYSWLEATGDRQALAEALEAAEAPASGRRRAWSHGSMMALSLALQAAAGRLRPSEVWRWRRWWAANRGVLSDPYLDASDPMPGLAEALRSAAHLALHPRSTWRSARNG